MAERTLSKALVFLVCLMNVKFAVSHMCTRGADYMFCHRVSLADGQIVSWDVYTVDQCRDICEREGCIAFEYHARPHNKLQTCRVYHGTGESVELEPTFDVCNDVFWKYSWKRPIRKSKGNCTIPE